MGNDKKGKSSPDKNAKVQGSKKKKNVDKKKSTDEENARKYGHISPSSITIYAECIGISGLAEDVAKALAEDVSYRLRYIIQNCSKYAKHAKRRMVTCEDVNQALKLSDCPPLYGHVYNAHEPLAYSYIKEADVFVTEDQVIDLCSYALSEIDVPPKPTIYPTGAWLTPDETKPKSDKIKTDDVPGSSSDHKTEEQKKSDSTKPSQSESTVGEHEPKIPTNLIKYYGITCNTILGTSNIQLVLQDLSTNTRILPVIPFILNFITLALNKLTRERHIKRLLQCVEALTNNKNIDFTPYQPASRVANAVCMVIAVDKKQNLDHTIRYYAASVLAKVFRKWSLPEEQKNSVINKMGKLLYDVKVTCHVHYGAIVLLTALGYEALATSFFPVLDQYLPYLHVLKEEIGKISDRDVAMLEEAILNASAILYRIKGTDKRYNIENLDMHLYEYFGDSICNMRLNVLENPHNLLDMWGINREDDKLVDLQQKRRSRTLKYMNPHYRPVTNKPAIESVFDLPTFQKKRNSKIVFKFAGAIPVPEISLKRRRMDPRCSHFIPGKESEGHVVVVGKFWKKPKLVKSTFVRHSQLKPGNIFSIL